MKERPYVLYPGPHKGAGTVGAGRLAQCYGVRLIDCFVIREGDPELERLQLETVPPNAVHLHVQDDGRYPDLRLRRTTDEGGLIEWAGGPEVHGKTPGFRARWCHGDPLVVLRTVAGEVAGEMGVPPTLRQLSDEYVFELIRLAILSGRWPSSS